MEGSPDLNIVTQLVRKGLAIRLVSAQAIAPSDQIFLGNLPEDSLQAETGGAFESSLKQPLGHLH